MPEDAILKFPDKRLNIISKEVVNFNNDNLKFINILISIMKNLEGCVGLAAPQINNPIRIIVFDASKAKRKNKNNGLVIMNNPVIIKKEGEIITREGCLSVPEFTGNVRRYEKITVKAQDINGNEFEFKTEGFESVIVQHEIDHLNGILFLDRIICPKDLFKRNKRNF